MTPLELYEFAKVTVVLTAFLCIMAAGFFTTVYILVDTTYKLCKIIRAVYRSLTKKQKPEMKEKENHE